jgi:hypothetical protein
MLTQSNIPHNVMTVVIHTQRYWRSFVESTRYITPRIVLNPHDVQPLSFKQSCLATLVKKNEGCCSCEQIFIPSNSKCSITEWIAFDRIRFKVILSPKAKEYIDNRHVMERLITYYKQDIVLNKISYYNEAEFKTTKQHPSAF